ncbi:MAG: extracellular solute-binding protein [Clostridia bacterium]|nr:extracellular solute-binding protein [Clostridia bacterium]
MKYGCVRTIKRTGLRMLALVLVLIMASTFCVIEASEIVAFDWNAIEPSQEKESYEEYINKFQSEEYSKETVKLTAPQASFDKYGKSYYDDDCEGRPGVYQAEGEAVSWSFQVKESGLYYFKLEYFTVKGTGGSIERKIKLDGEVPFVEAESFSFSRLWHDSKDEPDIDIQGNEIMIEQEEFADWTEQYALDPSGLISSPLCFYLSAGQHTVTLESISEPTVIGSATFVSPVECETYSYSTVSKGYSKFSSVKSESTITLQAEDADVKSSQMLYAVSDRTSPTVEPYSPYKILYNTVGGSMWSNADQWIEWKFTVKESGLYAISSHFKQAFKDSRGCCRRITIDGETPFTEAECWLFPYGTTWQSAYFSDEAGKPYEFYLEKGEHTIRMSVSLGDYTDVIIKSDELLNELNGVYRQIIAVTGANPDPYRDYRFDKTLPDAIEQMKVLSKGLKQLEKDIFVIEGNSASMVDVKRLYTNIDLMLRDTDKISVRLTTFKENIASFGTWINEQRGQPLQLDWIRLSSSSEELSEGEVNFFKLAAHYFKSFFSSFVMDYAIIGQTEIESDKEITIWSTTSQDQAQILRQMTNSNFTPNTDIAVQVQLVAATALLPSILAHKGPDVVLGIPQADVNNLALRGAAENLYNYFDESYLKEQFHEYSLNAFSFRDGIYAMPEVQTWTMMFYRKDILQELNIQASDLSTWDSILETVLPKLKKSSLSFGLLPTIDNYITFLYQNGGSLYTEDTKKSLLASDAAIDSMKLFSILYKEYGFDISFDFANRFRNGEMPIAVVDFTMYNNLMMFAPEIKNLWGMLPVPGTVGEDGNVSHLAVTRSAGTVLMADSDNKKASAEFLKWWGSSETQDSFGKSLEAIVGSAARYNPANKNAMKLVRWNQDMKDSMLYQQENLKEYTEVPGGYYTSRLFEFSLRNIVYENYEVRKTMNDAANDITIELENKRNEYNLE